jgi:hypothetical protein
MLRHRLSIRAFGAASSTVLLTAVIAACSANAPAPQQVSSTTTTAPAAGDPSWSPAPVVPLASQPDPALLVDEPLPDQLAMGLVVIRYRAENMRIVAAYGPGALSVSPRIGHIHVVVDDAPWHWADGSGEPLIIQALPPGPHKVWIGLADPTHHVVDSKTVNFVIPAGQAICTEQHGRYQRVVVSAHAATWAFETGRGMAGESTHTPNAVFRWFLWGDTSRLEHTEPPG